MLSKIKHDVTLTKLGTPKEIQNYEKFLHDAIRKSRSDVAEKIK